MQAVTRSIGIALRPCVSLLNCSIKPSDIKGFMILKNVISCFKPSYRSVQMSPRFRVFIKFRPASPWPSGPHASGSKLHNNIQKMSDYRNFMQDKANFSVRCKEIYEIFTIPTAELVYPKTEQVALCPKSPVSMTFDKSYISIEKFINEARIFLALIKSIQNSIAVIWVYKI